MSDIWSKVMDAVQADTYWAIEKLRQDAFLTGMGSEIERAFAAYIMLASRVQALPFYFGNEFKAPKHGFYLGSQVEVENFRVDFVLGTTMHMSSFRRSVAIECDGHDFHEKTKEQAARDKARDRVLAKTFGAVVHFTGSEIYRDVNGCWSEALGLLNTLNEDAKK